MRFGRTAPQTTLDQEPGRIQPSESLRELVRSFFQLVDNAAADPAAVKELEDKVLNAMRAERIPYNSAQEAMWIARWLYVGEPQARGRNTRIMFAKAPTHSHVSEYDPIRDGVSELTATPFGSAEEERTNAQRLIPVLVTVEPLRDFQGATYQR